MTTKELLYRLAVQANNTLMQGSYSGDALVEAADTMALCHKIVKAINDEETGKTGQGSTGESQD